jgi:membrane-bound lytic murein transglycosylase D
VTVPSLVSLLGVYLESGLLLLLGGLVTGALVRWGGARVAAAPRRFLRWSLLLLALALLAPALWRLPDGPPPRAAAVEVWSGPRPPVGGPAGPVALTWPSSAGAARAPGLRLERAVLLPLLIVLAGGAALSGAGLLRARRRLTRLCRSLPVIKRHGRVRLCASDQAAAPFAARAGGCAYIVVPTALLADPTRLGLVLDHEAEHHRRGDLRVASMFGLLRTLFFWNPGLALWERALAELQDLACDRRVLTRRRLTGPEYLRCLLWAAEVAGGPRYLLAGGARAMAASSAPTLRRRILMLTKPVPRRAHLSGVLSGLLAATLLAGTSWAVQGSIAERKLTREQLASVASRIEARSRFPLLVDDRVAEAVNRRIATPEARELTRRVLQRMRNYRPMIEDVLRKQGLPLELLGMVYQESAFDNEARPDRPPERQAAGIWQFIPATARKVGLQVSPISDERLEPRRATEAAAGLLADLHRQFGDWPLAIAAYNGGSEAVRGLTEGLSVAVGRARVLAARTEFGRYLPAVMASIVLIEEPSLAD